MPGILTPPQRVSRLYSHTFAAENGRPTHDVADIIVLGAAGDARSRALSPPARCHSFGRILPPSSHPSAQGSEREGGSYPSVFAVSSLAAADGDGAVSRLEE